MGSPADEDLLAALGIDPEPAAIVVDADDEPLDAHPYDSADGVVAREALRRAEDPYEVLELVREIGRVLRTGSWAAFAISTAPAPPADPGARRVTRRGILRGLVESLPVGPPHPPVVTLEALAAAALDGGLQLERIEDPGTARTLVRAVKLEA